MKAERWQLLDDNMEKDIKLWEMEEQGQEYMAHSKEEKERCRAEVELVWVQYEEEFEGGQDMHGQDVYGGLAVDQILHFKGMEVPKEGRLPSL